SHDGEHFFMAGSRIGHQCHIRRKCRYYRFDLGIDNSGEAVVYYDPQEVILGDILEVMKQDLIRFPTFSNDHKCYFFINNGWLLEIDPKPVGHKDFHRTPIFFDPYERWGSAYEVAFPNDNTIWKSTIQSYYQMPYRESWFFEIDCTGKRDVYHPRIADAAIIMFGDTWGWASPQPTVLADIGVVGSGSAQSTLIAEGITIDGGTITLPDGHQFLTIKLFVPGHNAALYTGSVDVPNLMAVIPNTPSTPHFPVYVPYVFIGSDPAFSSVGVFTHNIVNSMGKDSAFSKFGHADDPNFEDKNPALPAGALQMQVDGGLNTFDEPGAIYAFIPYAGI
ncbi:MAG: hypothetical protein LPH21_13350, partial [Shewanella sp.]|nr:hypothetical protein [Shewanella sp.]